MKPILFSGPMVRAILEGRKTQTLRVVKPNPKQFAHVSNCGDHLKVGPMGNKHIKPCYSPGDLLWVRETHAFFEDDGLYPKKLKYCDSLATYPGHAQDFRDGCRHVGVLYRATDDPNAFGLFAEPFRWRPSIFMPRWAARLFLRVTSVRVERVQDICIDDAIDEGSYLGRCQCLEMQRKPKTPLEAIFTQTWCHKHGEEFSHLWDSINAKRGYGWASNPWVWVYEFERVKETGE